MLAPEIISELVRPVKEIYFKPQEGPQTTFLNTSSDIAIFGGAAGGSKTYGLLLEPLRHINRQFDGVIFRQTYADIMKPGSLWDSSASIYGILGAHPKQSSVEWIYRDWKIKFSYMMHELDKLSWQGAQLSFIGFDELSHFSESQFFYMMSRLRSSGDVRPYIRATCNPLPDSWLSRLLEWYWDPDTGYAIPERSGVIRYFIREGDRIVWGDSPEELSKNYPPEEFPQKSFTFIMSSVYDNKILLKNNPDYLSNLKALPTVEREQLLKGNWKIKHAAGLYFSEKDFEIVDAHPPLTKTIRYWDRAATKKTDSNDPAWTAGVKMGRGVDGLFYILDVIRFREDPGGVEKGIKNITTSDGKEVDCYLEQDPGQAGKFEVQYLVRALAGYNAKINRVTDSKGKRASPLSAQAQAGNVKLLRGHWNRDFINEARSFDPEDSSVKKDQIDAASGAFSMLFETVEPRIRFL